MGTINRTKFTLFAMFCAIFLIAVAAFAVSQEPSAEGVDSCEGCHSMLHEDYIILRVLEYDIPDTLTDEQATINVLVNVTGNEEDYCEGHTPYYTCSVEVTASSASGKVKFIGSPAVLTDYVTDFEESIQFNVKGLEAGEDTITLDVKLIPSSECRGVEVSEIIEKIVAIDIEAPAPPPPGEEELQTPEVSNYGPSSPVEVSVESSTRFWVEFDMDKKENLEVEWFVDSSQETGTVSGDQTSLHRAFTSPGQHTVEVSLSNKKDPSKYSTWSWKVNVEPKVKISAKGPTSLDVEVGQEVALTYALSEGRVYTIEWDVDGSPVPSSEFSGGRQDRYYFTPDTAGTHQVRVSVTDKFGTTDSVTYSVIAAEAETEEESESKGGSIIEGLDDTYLFAAVGIVALLIIVVILIAVLTRRGSGRKEGPKAAAPSSGRVARVRTYDDDEDEDDIIVESASVVEFVEEKPKAKPRRMEIECPGCEHIMHVEVKGEGQKITCSECGLSGSL